MANGWSVHSLFELADYINGRATKPSELVAGGVPVIKIAELHGGISDRTNRIPVASVRDQHRVRDGDLLFAWSGSVGVHVYRGPDAALNQHIFRVVARDTIDQRFLQYLLSAQMDTFQAFVDDKKTTMGHVTVRDLKATSVRVPPLTEQRAIAHVLGTLDDKIEFNRRMNETLEEMARALFKSWFVDFDPVRAKASLKQHALGNHACPDTELSRNGVAPAGEWTVERARAYLDAMDPQIADLFPDRFVPSEVGKIPEGSEVRSLDEIADFTNGLALQRFPPEGEEWLPVIKIAEMRRGYTDKTVQGVSEPRPSVHRRGRRSAVFVVGQPGVGVLDSWPRWPSTSTCSRSHRTNSRSGFYWGWISEHLDDFRAIAAGKATTMGHIQAAPSDGCRGGRPADSRYRFGRYTSRSSYGPTRGRCHSVTRPRRPAGCALDEAGIGRGEGKCCLALRPRPSVSDQRETKIVLRIHGALHESQMSHSPVLSRNLSWGNGAYNISCRRRGAHLSRI